MLTLQLWKVKKLHNIIEELQIQMCKSLTK